MYVYLLSAIETLVSLLTYNLSRIYNNNLRITSIQMYKEFLLLTLSVQFTANLNKKDHGETL